MTTILYLPEPDEWTDGLSIRVVCAARDNMARLQWLIRWHVKIGLTSEARVTSSDILREIGIYMPRKAKDNGTVIGHGGNSGSGQNSRNELQWGNCKLSVEDTARLEQDTSTVEYLATCLAALADDGYGISLSSKDQGKSRCCTVIRPDFPSRGRSVGCSAFGDNIRDAILTCLFKLDNYGGGDFSGFDLESTDIGTRPRFR